MTMKLRRFYVILPLELHFMFPQNPEASDSEATYLLTRCCGAAAKI
jgi:hypothetical protein